MHRQKLGQNKGHQVYVWRDYRLCMINLQKCWNFQQTLLSYWCRSSALKFMQTRYVNYFCIFIIWRKYTLRFSLYVDNSRYNMDYNPPNLSQGSPTYTGRNNIIIFMVIFIRNVYKSPGKSTKKSLYVHSKIN